MERRQFLASIGCRISGSRLQATLKRKPAPHPQRANSTRSAATACSRARKANWPRATSPMRLSPRSPAWAWGRSARSAWSFGSETPAIYVLIPGPSAQALAEIDLRLVDDAAFMKAADPFWNATAAAPPFLRVESSLLSAFPGWPKLTPPASSATKAKRIFQLRTYESPSNGAHVRKVEMFHNGEFEIFLRAGFHLVFFGDTLIGSRMPNLTYMVSFADQVRAGRQVGRLPQ